MSQNARNPDGRSRRQEQHTSERFREISRRPESTSKGLALRLELPAPARPFGQFHEISPRLSNLSSATAFKPTCTTPCDPSATPAAPESPGLTTSCRAPGRATGTMSPSTFWTSCPTIPSGRCCSRCSRSASPPSPIRSPPRGRDAALAVGRAANPNTPRATCPTTARGRGPTWSSGPASRSRLLHRLRAAWPRASCRRARG